MGADGQFEGNVWTGCTIAPGAPTADLEAARVLFAEACRPAEYRRIENALAEMAVLCKARAEDTGDIAARIGIFAAKLREYPGDVALEAVRNWGGSEKWFPSWAELRQSCDKLGSKRMAVYRAVCVA